jgi:hypothetical protein
MSGATQKVIILTYPEAQQPRQGLFMPTGAEAHITPTFLDELARVGCPLPEVLTAVLTSPQPVCIQIAKILADTLKTTAYIINSLTSRLENPADLMYCGLGDPGNYFGELNRLQLSSLRVSIKHMNDVEAIVDEFPEASSSVFNRLQAAIWHYFTTIQCEFRAVISNLRDTGVRPHEQRANPVLVVVTHLEAVQATAERLRLSMQEGSGGFRYVQANYDLTANDFVPPSCDLVRANIRDLGWDDDLIEVQRGLFDMLVEGLSLDISRTYQQEVEAASKHQAQVDEIDGYLEEAKQQYAALLDLSQAALDLGQEMLKSSSSS